MSEQGVLMKLSLMPTWTCSGMWNSCMYYDGNDLIWSLACGGCPWLEVEALVLIESMDC